MISTLTGSDSDKQIKTSWNITKVPYTTFYEINCDAVYNVAYGQVVYVGKGVSGLWTVSVMVNSTEMIRYGNLISVCFKVGQYANQGEQIGTADGFTRFEYCTKYQGTSNYVIHINNLKFFKQDPTEIVTGEYVLTPLLEVTYSASNGTGRRELTEDQKAEFSDNKG